MGTMNTDDCVKINMPDGRVRLISPDGEVMVWSQDWSVPDTRTWNGPRLATPTPEENFLEALWQL